MRLAAHQQHLEPIAHAVHHEGGAVVVEGELLRHRAPPRPRRHWGRRGRSGICTWFSRPMGSVRDPRRPAILAQRHPRLAARLRQGVGQIVDPERDRHFLADETEARRRLHQQPAVLLAGLAGDEGMERRGEIEMVGGGHVVHLAVGDHHRAGDALLRHVGERMLERRIELRAGVGEAGARLGRARMHHAEVEVGKRFQLLRHLVERLLGHLPAVADAHARAVVDHHHGDVALGLAVLLDQGGIGEDHQQYRSRQQAPERAARPAPGADRKGQQRQPAEGRDHPPRQQRRGREGEAGEAHWPRRSRIAGTCTWSVL